ncbi:hypothetical protein GCM10029992_13760 [Glycomyces albus]
MDATGITVEDLAIDGPHGPIPVRTYRPADPLNAALVWAHGGGFLAGDLDMLEGHMVSMELARRAGAAVVSVDYRLAGDGVRHPVPIDDLHAAWLWWSGQDSFRDLPIAIGGASAGGALATSVAMRVRDRAERTPDSLLLAYPWAHFPVPVLSASLLAEMEPIPWRFDPSDSRARSRTTWAGSTTSHRTPSRARAASTACRPPGSSSPNTTTCAPPPNCWSVSSPRSACRSSRTCPPGCSTAT